jgi:hypothetical protein
MSLPTRATQGLISEIVRSFHAPSRFRKQGNRRGGLKGNFGRHQIAAEILEDRVLMTAEMGYGSSAGEYLRADIYRSTHANGLSFSVTDYGYGFAVGELTGQIVGDVTGTEWFTLEIDYGNENDFHYFDMASSEVDRIWAKIQLPYSTNRDGGVSGVMVRLKGEGQNLSWLGPWVSGQFVVSPPANAAPVVSNLRYTPSDGGYGLSGFITGNIADASAKFSNYELQIDVDADGSVDTRMSDEQFFAQRNSFTHSFIPRPGEQTVAVRVQETDANSGQVLNSEWATLEIDPVIPDNEVAVIDYLNVTTESYWMPDWPTSDSGYGTTSGDDGYGVCTGMPVPTGYGSYIEGDGSYSVCTKMPVPTGYGSYTENDFVAMDVYPGKPSASIWDPTPTPTPTTAQDPPQPSGHWVYSLSVSGEFKDYTRESSWYSIEIDSVQPGSTATALDGIPDGSFGVQDFRFYIPGIGQQGLALRIRENDFFGRVYYGPWIPANAFGEPNKKPEFAQASSSIVLPYSQVKNGTQVGTWVATDPDGDELQYSVSAQPIIADRFLKNANPQSAVRPFVSIDKTTGALTIRNAVELKNAYRQGFRFDVVITAFDGKERALQNITLYDDYSSYLRFAQDHISAWEERTNTSITDNRIIVTEALQKVSNFGGELHHIGNVADVGTGAVATLALVMAPEVTALEAAVSLAAFGVKIVSMAEDEAIDDSNEAIMGALETEIQKIWVADRQRVKDTVSDERRKLNEFTDEISRKDQNGKYLMPPDMQARKAFEYLNQMESRLFVPQNVQLPTVNDVYCLLLVEYARVSNCSLYGSMLALKQHGEFWGSSDFNGAGCNGHDIMNELNRLKYVPPGGTFVRIKRR